MGILDIVLIVVAAILFLIGIIGCVVPGLPGVPLCWGGLLAGYFIHLKNPLTVSMLIISGVICVIVTIVDFIVPSYFTKKSGGSKAGSTGSTLGVLAGVLTGQLFLIFFGPFIGALIGELIHDSTDKRKALRSACYAFLGFITGTGLKLISSGWMIYVFIKSFF